MRARVVVVGAGVSGLTVALQLAKTRSMTITVIAKHMPGDLDIEFASPWAGANYMPFSKPGTSARVYERQTWPELARLAQNVPGAGIHFQEVNLYRRKKDDDTPIGDLTADLMNPNAWFKDMVPNFRTIPTTDLPAGVDSGTTFTSVCINPDVYLQWLLSQCLEYGVIIKRAVISHIEDARHSHHSGRPADVIVNCTGLGSLMLKGVQDTNLYPLRGQIVLVRNDPGQMFCVSGVEDGPDEVMYMMARAAGGGTILGGSMQPRNWESQPDRNLSNRIMKRCIEFCPALVPEGGGIHDLDIIRFGVGLRPVREGGIRLEKEVVEARDGSAITIVHNYGHAGYGYQTSFGCADAVRTLVAESLTSKPKL